MTDDKILIQRFSFYTSDAFRDTAKEIERRFGLDKRFVCLTAFVQRLIEILQSLLDEDQNDYRILHRYLVALEDVKKRGLLPRMTLKDRWDPLKSYKQRYPIAACFLEPIKTLQSDNQTSICEMLLLHLLLNDAKTYSIQNYDEIRRLFSSSQTNNELIKVINSTLKADICSNVFRNRVLQFIENKSSDKHIKAAKAILQVLEFCLQVKGKTEFFIKNKSTNVTINHRILVDKTEYITPSKKNVVSENYQPTEIKKEPTKRNKDNVTSSLSSAWISNFQQITKSDYSYIDDEEKNFFVSEIYEEINQNRKGLKDAAILLLIMYLTSCSVDEVIEFTVAKNGDLTLEGLYRKTIIMPIASYNADISVKGQLPQLKVIELPLPSLISRWLKSFNNINISISGLLNREKLVLKSEIELCSKNIRDKSLFKRLTLGKISRALKNEIMLQKRDEGLLWILTCTINHEAAMINYYVAYDAKSIQDAFIESMKCLLGQHYLKLVNVFEFSNTLISNAVTTSHPTTECIESICKSAKNAVKKATSSGDIVEIHNAYTDYCLLLLMFASGHRPTNDPFPCISHFNLDLGFMLISDKTTRPQRQWRLVALPDIAIEQVKTYRDYLLKLSSKLQENAIFEIFSRRLMDSFTSTNTILPLFFYLCESKNERFKQITTIELEQRWAKFWDWPPNYPRHAISTELFKSNVPGDYLKYQLGHNYSNKDHNGIRAFIAPLQIVQAVSPHLDKILEKWGWYVMKSPIYQTSPYAPKTTCQYDELVLGYKERATRRNKNRKSLTLLINKTIKELFNKSSIPKLSAKQFLQLQQNIELNNSISENVKKKCLGLISRFERFRQNKFSDATRDINYFSNTEYSPLSENTVLDYSNANSLRQKFTDYLNRQGKCTSFDKETRLAEITVSAALCGRLLESNLLSNLCGALSSVLYRLGESLFVEYPEYKNTKQHFKRWYPDSITQGLIIGLFRRLNQPTFAYSASKYTRCLKQLMLRLGYEGKDQIDYLVNNGRALTLIELPGFMRTYAQLQNFGSSIPIASLVRIKSDEKLHERQTIDRNTSLSASKLLLLKPRYVSNASATKSLRDLKRLLQYIEKEISTRRIRAEYNKNAKQVIKTELSNALSTDDTWDENSLIAINYIIYTCEVGTANKQDCAYKTIRDYAGEVISFLQTTSDTFNSFDDEEYLEKAYLNYLQQSKRENLDKTLTVLSQFHYFLVEQYCAQEINWSECYRYTGCIPQNFKNNANLVSENEYYAILESLLAVHTSHTVTNEQLALLVILGFRFGLRFGEAWGALRSDLVISKQLKMLVKKNGKRALKSGSSTRFVRLEENLSDLEKRIIDGYLKSLEISHDKNLNTLLFQQISSDVLQHIDRHEATQIIHHVMRTISGDFTLRFHHLRHSYASRLINDIVQTDLTSPNAKLFKDFHKLKEVSVKLGHADEVTTISSYCHVLDELLPRVYTQCENLLGDFGKAYCLQTTYEKVRQQKSNKCATHFSSLKKNKVVKSCLQIPNITTKTRDLFGSENSKSRSLVELSIYETECVLYALCNGTANEFLVSSKFNLDPHAIKQVLFVAAEIENESQFLKYNARAKLNTPSYSIESKTQKIGSVDQNSRIRKCLKRLSNDVLTNSDISRQLNCDTSVWLKTYCPKSKGNVIFNSDNIVQFTNLKTMLNLKSHLMLVINDESQLSYWRGTVKKLELDITIGKVGRANSKCAQEQQRRAKLKFSNTKDNLDFARMMFVLSVFIRVKEIFNES